MSCPSRVCHSVSMLLYTLTCVLHEMQCHAQFCWNSIQV